MITSEPKTRDGVIVTPNSKLWTAVEDCPIESCPDFEFWGQGFSLPRMIDLSQHPSAEITQNNTSPSIGWGLRFGLVFYSLNLYFSTREAAWKDFLGGVDRSRRSLQAIADQNMAGGDDEYLAMLDAEDRARAASLTEAWEDGRMKEMIKDLARILNSRGFAKPF